MSPSSLHSLQTIHTASPGMSPRAASRGRQKVRRKAFRAPAPAPARLGSHRPPLPTFDWPTDRLTDIPAPLAPLSQQQASLRARLPLWFLVLIIHDIGLVLLCLYCFNHKDSNKIPWSWLSFTE